MCLALLDLLMYFYLSSHGIYLLIHIMVMVTVAVTVMVTVTVVVVVTVTVMVSFINAKDD